MGRIRVRAVKRREVDEDKLALAFLMLAKALREQHCESETERQPSSEAAS
jgi:hypothetical protein